MASPTPSMLPASPRERVRVLKFGGAALAEGSLVRRALERSAPQPGERVVLVVSAIGEATDLLEGAARDAAAGAPDSRAVRLRHKRLLAELELPPGLLNPLLTELDAVLGAIAERGACSPAERDHALSFGERMSARLVAAALRASGVAATPVDAWDVGLESDSNHGRARPLEGATRAMGRAIAAVPGIPVVTGFVAADGGGRLTTLGRNGSDLSAALIAAAVGAHEVQFWKLVAGVHSADPKLVPAARPLRELSYAQAAALAYHGAGVLHPDTLAPLEHAGVPARVLSLCDSDDPGTRIASDCRASGVLGVASRRGLVRLRIAVDSSADRGVAVARLGAALESSGIEPLLLHGGPSEYVLVAQGSEELTRLAAGLPGTVECERSLATLALVAASARELDLVAAHGALRAAHVESLHAWVDGARGSAVWLLPESRLSASAHALHALCGASQHGVLAVH
jgi:aspartate kinase